MFYYIRNNTIRGFTKVDSYKGENKILVDGNVLGIQIAGVAPYKLLSDKCTCWYFDTDGNIYRNLKSKNDIFKPSNGNLVTDLFVEDFLMIILYSNGAVDACYLESHNQDLQSVLNLAEGGIMKVIYGIQYGSYHSEYLYKITTITEDFKIRLIEFNISITSGSAVPRTPMNFRVDDVDNCTVERVIDAHIPNCGRSTFYCAVVDLKGDIWTGKTPDSLTLKDIECKVKKMDIRKYYYSLVFLMDNGEVYQSSDLRGVENHGIELIKIPFATKITDIVTAKLGHDLDYVVALDEKGNLATANIDIDDEGNDWQIRTSEKKDKEITFPGGQNTSRFSTTKRAKA